MSLTSEKRSIAILFIFILAISLFSPTNIEAAKTKTAYVDVKSGKLNVHSGPGTKYKVIDRVKDKTKLTIYSETKNGWAETRVNKEKGYVSKESLRFYKKMSNAEAQKITDTAVDTQLKIRRLDSFTKKQAHSVLSSRFTKGFINKFIKYNTTVLGKNKKRETLYQANPGFEDPSYSPLHFDWTPYKYSLYDPPTVKSYTKNGKQYLYVRQMTVGGEHGRVEQKLYLSRTSSKEKWKVYNYSLKFHDYS